MSLAAGDTFAGFHIVRKLGAGGMGEVYLVDHPRLPRQEALKILPTRFTSDAEFRSRFNREAELVAAIWHPHIVAVHDRGESNGQFWITMGYVEGTDAFQMIRDHFPSGVPTKFAAEIVTAVADALDYAHERGLLHRDVKPANILLSDADPSSQRRRILLSDFGVAREMADDTGLTATNMTVGSVAYSAPEQLMGLSLDGRADQYALAATAYQLLTGRPPFENSNAAVVITSHLSSPPPRMGDRRPDLGALDAVILRGLAKDPADRYPTCGEFAAALAAATESGTPSRVDHPTMGAAPGATPPAAGPTLVSPLAPPPAPPPLAPPAAPPAPAKRSRRTGWIIAAILVVVLVVAGVVLVPQLFGSDDESGSTTAADATGGALPASAVTGLLLSAGELAPILGETLQQSQQSSGPLDASLDFDRPECAGAIYPLESRVYDRSGVTAARQALFAPPEGAPGNHIVDQSVALLPTAEDAEQLRARSQREWQACAGTALTITTSPDQITNPTLDNVEANGDLIIQNRTVEGDAPPGQRCQHTMGVWNNVVAEAVVCNDTDVGDESQQIVEQILTKASSK